jgi:LacI family transcriptional regulator
LQPKWSVTLNDIAREAGVNVSTVSRALNMRNGVRKEVRDKVQAVAKRLGYRPNLIARGLVTGRSHSLGLLISDIRNPFFAELVRGAEDAAHASGYHVLLCNSDMDPAKQMEYFWSLINNHVGGILISSIAIFERHEVDQIVGAGVPVVLLNRPKKPGPFSTVLSDNPKGGAIAAEHLAQLGHRNVAVLAGPRRHGNLNDRVNGFLRAFQSKQDGRNALVVPGVNTFAGGYEMTRKLIARKAEFTAIFAASDIIAFGAIRALNEAGLRIPDNISLVGFDDVEMAAIVHPPLTTIQQPKYEIGAAAMEILLKQADKKDVPAEHRIFDVKLIERESCRKL